MTAIWSPENRYKIWWRIEVFAAEAMGRIGMIPAEDAAHGRVYGRFALKKPIMFQPQGICERETEMLVDHGRTLSKGGGQTRVMVALPSR